MGEIAFILTEETGQAAGGQIQQEGVVLVSIHKGFHCGLQKGEMNFQDQGME